MKAATPENRLYVHVTEQNQDLFSVKLDRVLLGDEYDSIDFNLDIAKRLVMIENQYGIQFPIDQALSNEDTELVWFLSDSIMGKPSGFTWENFNMTAVSTIMIRNNTQATAQAFPILPNSNALWLKARNFSATIASIASSHAASGISGKYFESLPMSEIFTA